MNLTHVSRIAFGRTKPDGGTVSAADWALFEANDISTRFPDGFTIIHALGAWRDVASKDTIREPSTILEIAHDGGEEAFRAIRAIAFTYKMVFNQDAVMISTARQSVEFV